MPRRHVIMRCLVLQPAGEGDLEIGLPSLGLDGGISSVDPGQRALESYLSGKCLNQSPSRALDSTSWN